MLLQRLLDRAVLDADAQQAVLRRAEGNPLYAEEYARMLAEHGGGDLPLPETVQGLIAARIDGLAAGREGSAAGRVGDRQGLLAGRAGDGADDRVLHALERKEFIRRDRRSSIAGETQYAFLHALVRDVAYGQIPRAERAEKHRRAAEWLASLAGDRTEDLAEMLAHHYREALSLGAAAGLDTTALRGPARQAFADGAQRALSLGVGSTALELAKAALELTPEDAAERAALAAPRRLRDRSSSTPASRSSSRLRSTASWPRATPAELRKRQCSSGASRSTAATWNGCGLAGDVPSS